MPPAFTRMGGVLTVKLSVALRITLGSPWPPSLPPHGSLIWRSYRAGTADMTAREIDATIQWGGY